MKKFLAIFVPILLVAAGIVAWFFGFRGDNATVSNNTPTVANNAAANVAENEAVTNTVNNSVVEEDEEASEPEPLPVTSIDHAIPFTSQAATGEWGDPRQQDACEEASALMAIWWARDKKPTSTQDARAQILAIADFQKKQYGSYKDTDADDTVERIFRTYFEFEPAVVEKDIVVDDIIQELMNGRVVIVPADGQALGNPNFTAPGPERHMLLIRGYDADKKEFITNDPGTRRGEAYRYKQDVLFNAIREYPTGDHEPIVGKKKVMIVVNKTF